MIHITEEHKPDTAVTILKQIPEFEGDFTIELLEKRLMDTPIILVAFHNDLPVGCKIGYDRYQDGSFYSWLGGVLPEFRKKGIADQLNAKMEKRVSESGYTALVFKTRNKFKSMLQFGLKNGYQIVGFEEKDDPSENRIILKKQL